MRKKPSGAAERLTGHQALALNELYVRTVPGVSWVRQSYLGQIRSSTLLSLEKRGMVVGRSFFYGGYVPEWQITSKGLAWVEARHRTE